MIDGVHIRLHVQPDSSKPRYQVHIINTSGHRSRANKPLEYENWPISKYELGVLQMTEGKR